ncbi:MAG: efflux RND transporter periplasmic adaptor subunit [Pirellulales bacterium]|nr:efflux RND transporter periplasmic adaptor subunit [Pirellulales bacterium]
MPITTENSSRIAVHAGDTPARTSKRPVLGIKRRYLIRMALILACILLFMGCAYAAMWLFGSLESETAKGVSLHPAARGELLITVTEDGNVESAINIDIKCEVAGGSSILWIIEDGKEVKKGDKLVELDSSALEDQINTQKITYNKARAALIQAQKNFEVAQIAVKEYIEGTFVKELEDIKTQITIAEENLQSSQNSRDYSVRMFRRGYISELEMKSQQFAVRRAELELNSAKMARDVLEKFTKEKMLEELRSQVETSQAALESEQASFELEESKLKRLETQLKSCMIYAPQDGMVVYANEVGRHGQQSVTIEEGAMVREQQDILRLPDLSQMQVRVNVHETRVEDLEVNMRARVKIQGREFQGFVVSIANQPEPTNWFQGDVKEYATIVRINGQPEGLKPGMTAEVEILIAHLKDILMIPVSAIVEIRGAFVCWVKNPEGQVERRPLVLGMTNDKFVEVQDGIVEGDAVIRNPRAVVDESRSNVAETEQVNVEKRFGDSASIPQTPSEQDTGPSDRQMGPGADGPRPDQATQPDTEGTPRPGREDRPGGNQRGPQGGMDLIQLDTDKDGKISKAEAPEQMRPFFDRMDGNRDGFIDAQEREALRNQFRPGERSRSPQRDPQAPPR